MSFKTLLCLFSGKREDLGTLEMAFALARHHEAALRILHLAQTPARDRAAAQLGVPALATGVSQVFLDEEALEEDEEVRAFAAEFAKGHAMELLAADAAAPLPLQAHVRTVIGEPEDCLPLHGMTVDMIVCGVDHLSGAKFKESLAAVTRTGCAVLMVPPTPVAMAANGGRARTITVGWDRSVEATRALQRALPLLKGAETVHILSIREGTEIPGEASHADLLAYLENHGISADIVSPNRDFQTVGEVLLWHSARLGAELLVVGAYSRGHLAEKLTFGTSDHVHRHARIPIFMTH